MSRHLLGAHIILSSKRFERHTEFDSDAGIAYAVWSGRISAGARHFRFDNYNMKNDLFNITISFFLSRVAEDDLYKGG